MQLRRFARFNWNSKCSAFAGKHNATRIRNVINVDGNEIISCKTFVAASAIDVLASRWKLGEKIADNLIILIESVPVRVLIGRKWK